MTDDESIPKEELRRAANIGIGVTLAGGAVALGAVLLGVGRMTRAPKMPSDDERMGLAFLRHCFGSELRLPLQWWER